MSFSELPQTSLSGFIIIIIITMSFAQTGLDNIALHKQKGNVLTLDL
jgi:hypothetical protein